MNNIFFIELKVFLIWPKVFWIVTMDWDIFQYAWKIYKIQSLLSSSIYIMLKHLQWTESIWGILKIHLWYIKNIYLGQTLPASVAQLDAPSDWRPGGRRFNPRRGRQHSFVEIDHEIFSTVILSLPLIQEGQLSVSGERMCTILVNRLED